MTTTGRRKVTTRDENARKAITFLASMCYHMIGDLGYRQIEEMLSDDAKPRTEIRAGRGGKRGRG